MPCTVGGVDAPRDAPAPATGDVVVAFAETAVVVV